MDHTMLVCTTPDTEILGRQLEPPGCIQPLCLLVGDPPNTPIELALVIESERHEWPQRELATPLMGWVIEERRGYGPPNREDTVVLYDFGIRFPMHEDRRRVYADARANNTTLCLVVQKACIRESDWKSIESAQALELLVEARRWHRWPLVAK